MRVLEPHHFQSSKKQRRRKLRWLPLSSVLLLLTLAVVAGYVAFGQDLLTQRKQQPGDTPAQEVAPELEAAAEKEPVLRTFSGEEFKALYSSFAYPNTQPLHEVPTITGNPTADARIASLAKDRGYVLSAVPVSNIVKIDEPYLTEDDLLQQNAKIGWDGLSQAAKKAGVPLQITSAYRSIEFQRAMFLREMANAGITASGVADGYSDLALSRLMARVAPPGFSRHHNGYTIDLACGGVGLYAFINTSCYDWISKNNFEVAKQHGWVPSYPEEAEQQGPEPEPWEFIWVGTINLYE